ncbi:hypothetical protein [Streptomyces syringium]|uniref:hypothetical protein n=1 Tax=Streptomyces syringium TaxID=76729 RepID=UPI0037D4B1E2
MSTLLLLVLMLLVLVVLLAAGALAYLAHRWPALVAPLTLALAGVTVVVMAVDVIVSR